MHKTFTFLFLFSLISVNLFSQDHDHSHNHEHHHAKNEFGMDNSIVYFTDEAEIAYGLHLHYVRRFKESKFGYGIGYERIFDEHKHNTVGILFAYQPIEPVYLSLSPGITFEDGETEKRFTLHGEAGYNFDIGDIHLGPVLGAAYGHKEFHLSVGLHIGFGF